MSAGALDIVVRFIDNASRFCSSSAAARLRSCASAARNSLRTACTTLLVAEALGCQRRAEPFATVVFTRQLDYSIGHSVRHLEALAKAALPEDAQGQIIFL